MKELSESKQYVFYDGLIGKIISETKFYIDLELPDRETFSIMRSQLKYATKSQISEWKIQAFIERI